MTLLERIQTLKIRAESLKNQQSQVDEVSLLDKRLREVSEKAKGLSEASAKAVLLKCAGLVMDAAPVVSVARGQKQLKKIRTGFAEKRVAKTLTLRNDWPSLLRELETAIKEIRSRNEKSWRGYLDSLFTGEAPSQMQTRIAQTSHNNDVFRRYNALHDEFQKLKRRVPNDNNELEKSKKIAEQLISVVEEFDFNVPPQAVKVFLKAVSQGGAPLDMVTEEVSAWLVSNGQVNWSRVVARS